LCSGVDLGHCNLTIFHVALAMQTKDESNDKYTIGTGTKDSFNPVMAVVNYKQLNHFLQVNY